MTLSLVISNLTCGGAQRVLVLLADEWVRRGHRVEILTLADRPVYFQPDPRVSVTCLGVERPSNSPVAAVSQLRLTLGALRARWRADRPDAVVAFTTRVNAKVLLAARPLGLPVVVSERTDPQFGGEALAWRLLRRLTFPWARALVVQSPEAARYFAPWGMGGPVTVVGNPVPVDPLAVREPRDGLLVVSVGRLDPRKGHDLLLRAFARVTVAGARLRIVGEGPFRPDLEQLAAQLDLGDRCQFVGEAEPAPHLRDADVFALPSRVEGFPNALAEALAAGLACVSFDCPSGPRQLIEHGANGLLVPPEDPCALAQALEAVLRDLDLRKRLGSAARTSMGGRSVSAVTDQWDRVLGQAVGS